MTRDGQQVLNLGVLRSGKGQMVGVGMIRADRASLASQPWLMGQIKSKVGNPSRHCFCAKCGNDLTGRVDCATERNGMSSSGGKADRSSLLCVFCGASEVMSARSFRLGQVQVVQQTTMTLAPPV